ncbi:SIS domain-containing protein [Hoeflea sp.]|uniref:SIS domain-containing protein n=1 Tax=Hoeflea sp. TaxID=1940281 RepID=UPI003A9436D2
MTSMIDGYFDNLIARLTALKSDISEQMAAAAAAVAAAARADNRVYIFGTGHSHVMAEEMHYRAGGLAITVPILAAPIMLHEGAIAGTVYERTEGIVGPIMDRYDIRPGDVLFVISNSGVNAAPLEAARIGRERGCTVICITSVAYSTATANGRERLADLSDIVLDNGTPPGDAVMSVPGSELKAGPMSTAIGATILNAIFVDVAARLAADGDAPIYLSANMPGAKEINRKLVERFRPRNPHL